MFCWDEPSCEERYQSHGYWMSSANWTAQFEQGGIFSNETDESAWASANKAFVKYCSSDLWVGDVGASDATFGWSFRGSRIVAAVIASLVDKGMGASPGQRLLFSGCSAGGVRRPSPRMHDFQPFVCPPPTPPRHAALAAIGAMNNLDEVSAMSPPGLEVQGFLDAAALLDIPVANNGWPWASQLTELQQLVANVAGVVNPQLPASCLALFPGSEWKCMCVRGNTLRRGCASTSPRAAPTRPTRGFLQVGRIPAAASDHAVFSERAAV